MEGLVKPPQISEMFQKLALSFKSKAFEFFSDESEKVSLLDSQEKLIAEQKFVAVKPAPMLRCQPMSPGMVNVAPMPSSIKR